MKTRMMLVVVALSSLAAFAGNGGNPNKEGRFEQRFEEKQQEFHLKAVVAISQALELKEADSLKLSEKLKGFEARRQPLRLEMFKAMKAVKRTWRRQRVPVAQLQILVKDAGGNTTKKPERILLLP